jgi:hypothetical protein
MQFVFPKALPIISSRVQLDLFAGGNAWSFHAELRTAWMGIVEGHPLSAEDIDHVFFGKR